MPCLCPKLHLHQVSKQRPCWIQGSLMFCTHCGQVVMTERERSEGWVQKKASLRTQEKEALWQICVLPSHSMEESLFSSLWHPSPSAWPSPSGMGISECEKVLFQVRSKSISLWMLVASWSFLWNNIMSIDTFSTDQNCMFRAISSSCIGSGPDYTCSLLSVTPQTMQRPGPKGDF